MNTFPQGDIPLFEVDFAFPLEFDSRIMGGRRRRVHPAAPTTTNRPRKSTGPRAPRTKSRPPTADQDFDLWRVRQELLNLDPTGAHFAASIREAFDQAYDGQRTGRWDVTQLAKTEKTHIGTLIEIWLQRELAFEDGDNLDFAIAGIDVDCKWSQNLYEWEIPLEMYAERNEIALVVWANEDTSRWAAGLIRISEPILRATGNQDRKRKLNDDGADSILWVFREMPMIRNVLNDRRELATRLANQTSGQSAVNLLFREVQGELISQATIATAAQQIDPSKRARDARKDLAPEGIVILGPYQAHAEIATDLGLPRPGRSQFVSARVTPSSVGDDRPSASIDGTYWRVATGTDQVVHAPLLPAVKSS
ncbi:NaeI family type II restriction endonuclease [Tsukamurella strandjordii]|uniref:NaeI family type II restriction endonuclease n=1 Tax=Tsukamurella strandjordii TaxID=147577 RepID=A0AA90NAE8_9ACTN|nr:NaeI family type II restriction endonuclease [Tsukamurella strandjordii]MDP0398837.1 NaeI family type II restriction endonuclease [Tsukamurella strandjordii]